MSIPTTLATIAQILHDDQPARPKSEFLSWLIAEAAGGRLIATRVRPTPLPKLIGGPGIPDVRPTEINERSQCDPLDVCQFLRDNGEAVPKAWLGMLRPEQRGQFGVVVTDHAEQMGSIAQRRETELVGALATIIARLAPKYLHGGQPNSSTIEEAVQDAIRAATGSDELPQGWRSFRGKLSDGVQAYGVMLREAQG